MKGEGWRRRHREAGDAWIALQGRMKRDPSEVQEARKAADRAREAYKGASDNDRGERLRAKQQAVGHYRRLKGM